MTETNAQFGRPAKKVRCLDIETGKVIAEFKSINEAARETVGKMSARAAITMVCKGYQQTAYGYKWEYAE